MAPFDSIYDRLEAGPSAPGSAMEDIMDLTMDQMEDYFGDLDPILFL